MMPGLLSNFLTSKNLALQTVMLGYLRLAAERYSMAVTTLVSLA